MNQSSQEIFEIYKSLFKGRQDVYAVRREKGGKSGYTPAYNFDWNEFKTHQSKGGTIKDFKNKTLKPLTDEVLKVHLTGKQVIGIYPLLQNNSSNFIAIDFDKWNWIEECKKVLNACKEYNIPAYLERSRSGNGGHIWIFFENEYPALRSRQIMMILLKKAFNVSEFQKEFIFDRSFPNQDFLSGAGYGNLIALPLNGESLK